MQLIRSMLSSTASELNRPWRCMMSAAETAAQTNTFFFFFLTQNPNSNYPLWLYWIISWWDWLLAQENDERTPMTPCTAWPMMTCTVACLLPILLIHTPSLHVYILAKNTKLILWWESGGGWSNRHKSPDGLLWKTPTHSHAGNQNSWLHWTTISCSTTKINESDTALDASWWAVINQTPEVGSQCVPEACAWEVTFCQNLNHSTLLSDSSRII